MNSEMQLNYKLLETVGTVFVSKLEEEMVGMAYSATRLLKQVLETQKSIQVTMPVSVDRAVRASDVDQLVDRLNSLLDQLHQRHLSIADLEARVNHLQNSATDRQTNPLSQGAVTVLDHRIADLEQLFEAMRSIPALLEQQNRIIGRLDDRISRLELSQSTSFEGNVHEIEADRAL
jgi:chromosomal replication initiation ATPase DnaA